MHHCLQARGKMRVVRLTSGYGPRPSVNRRWHSASKEVNTVGKFSLARLPGTIQSRAEFSHSRSIQADGVMLDKMVNQE